MRIDTQTLATQSFAVQPMAPPGVPTGAIPERVFAARAARWVSLAVMVLAATAVVLLASGLAVVMSLT
jgi:hypothetical protein